MDTRLLQMITLHICAMRSLCGICVCCRWYWSRTVTFVIARVGDTPTMPLVLQQNVECAMCVGIFFYLTRGGECERESSVHSIIVDIMRCRRECEPTDGHHQDDDDDDDDTQAHLHTRNTHTQYTHAIHTH